jgi:hypothetical protein
MIYAHARGRLPTIFMGIAKTQATKKQRRDSRDECNPEANKTAWNLHPDS